MNALAAGAFKRGAVATDADDRIACKAAIPYYDADGSSAIAAVKFAPIITLIGTFDHTDFFAV